MGPSPGRVWAEIDLDAVVRNFRYAQARVGASVGILAVVKADAYRHGAVQVALTVEREGARALGVATPSEALELRDAGIRCPILVLGSCFDDEIPAAVERGVSLSLSPGEVMRPIAEAAARLDRPATVHLLIDTGMSRDGVPPGQAVELAGHVADTPELRLEGTYTHLATASMADKSFCHEQLARFRGSLAEMLARDISPGLVHCANSGGLFTIPAAHFDMVRQGIALYGLPPSDHVASQVDLEPAMTVKSRVIALREIDAGASVGYLREFVAKRRSRLATVSMGYADGLPLALSNRGQFLINGRHVSIVGRVMMDCCVADVTSLPSVRVGDEVVVIGKSGRNRITALDLARLAGTSTYEILCGLGRRVRRVYLRDGRPLAAPTDAAAPADLFEPVSLARPPAST